MFPLSLRLLALVIRAKRLQIFKTALVQLHYDVGGVDGVFGRGTESAVKSFQRDNNLDADGVVGAQTYRSLMNREMPVNRSGNSAAIRTVFRTAYNMRGVPYVFGGTSPYGFDCSGFTQYAFAAAGYNLPRMADSQYYAFRKVSSGNLTARRSGIFLNLRCWCFPCRYLCG
jgi:cell wall-associated NlpC family hydrolase